MVSRRRFLLGGLGAAIPGLGIRPLPRRALRCQPVISGPLWWYSPDESAAWGIPGWQEELDQERGIGFDLLWLANVPGALRSKRDTTALAGLLDLCARRKVGVLLDTGASAKWYGGLNLKREVAFCSNNITRIGESFAGHPSFHGWYISHEIYMSWDEYATYVEALYSALVERCRKAADLPVAISPFFILDRDKVFGDFRYNEPVEYGQFWSRLIARSGINIVMLQDSGEHFSYVTNEMRRPFFSAMHDACAAAKAKFWGNVETAEFECPSKAEYIRRYGRVHPSRIKGGHWRPVPISRLREKLALAAEYCERIVTWGYWEYCRPMLGKSAAEWYREYKSYYESLRPRQSARASDANHTDI